MIRIKYLSNIVCFSIQDIQDVSGGVTMAGDARFDSPGYCAKYSTYFMQVRLLCPSEVEYLF